MAMRYFRWGKTSTTLGTSHPPENSNWKGRWPHLSIMPHISTAEQARVRQGLGSVSGNSLALRGMGFGIGINYAVAWHRQHFVGTKNDGERHSGPT